MNCWKKYLLAAAEVLAVVVICIVGYFEIRFPHQEVVATLEGRENILREEPAAEITEADRTLIESIWVCPSVQNVTESVDLLSEDHPDIQEIMDAGLEGVAASEQSVGVLVMDDHRSLYVSWMEDEKKLITFQYTDRDGEKSCAKVIVPSFRQGESAKRSYQNINNEDWKRFEVRRRWLGYLREKLWEN